MSENLGKSGMAPRIMMIDDETANLEVVKHFLRKESFEPDLVFYEDGQSALDYLKSNPVDLILLDLQMPGMDGFEVMKHLKENPDTMEIPVIFLSAYNDTEFILKAFDMGATDFIGKPIISPILTARIRTIIQARTLQKELQRSNEELLNTNRLKDELLSICSHDLRSPLSSIDLVCQFLHEALDGKSQESKPELVNRIVSQSRVARRLVENLLDLNRIEEGRLVPSPSFFQINEVVRKCVEDEGPNMQAKALQHSVTLPEDDWLCFGDREMLTQVLHNVLNNAAKHSSTRVSIDCQVNEEGESLTVVISDDGPGIASEHHEAIFEKYGKVDHSGSGSGLGLYISRQMVELHHGRIHVDSENAGGGTRIVIELPNVFRADKLPQLSQFHESHVLIVSSSKSVAELLEGVLLEAGLVNVEQALHKDQLMERLQDPRNSLPNAVVVDVHSGDLVAALVDRGEPGLPSAGWILYGEEEASAKLSGQLPGPSVRISIPFNPLAYLREMGNILSSNGTQSLPVSV